MSSKREGFSVITDATDVPPNSIDLVYSSKVLEHIENNIEALRKLYASLKPGRRSKFWVPAFECLWSGIGRSTAAAIPVGRSMSRSGRRVSSREMFLSRLAGIFICSLVQRNR